MGSGSGSSGSGSGSSSGTINNENYRIRNFKQKYPNVMNGNGFKSIHASSGLSTIAKKLNGAEFSYFESKIINNLKQDKKLIKSYGLMYKIYHYKIWSYEELNTFAADKSCSYKKQKGLKRANLHDYLAYNN